MEPHKRIVFGVILFFVGLVITLATKDAAEAHGGGTYVVAYGPMIVGVINVLRGLGGIASAKPAPKKEGSS